MYMYAESEDGLDGYNATEVGEYGMIGINQTQSGSGIHTAVHEGIGLAYPQIPHDNPADEAFINTIAAVCLL